MKKVIVLCLVAVMLLLVGCDKEPPTDSGQSFGYTETDIESVIFTDIQNEITLDLSANNALKTGLMRITYDPDQKKTDAGEAIYELKIDGKSLYVYSENVAAYDGSEPYPCQEFDVLGYLDGMLVGEVTQLGGYAADASVEVKNKQGLVAQIKENGEFFTELGKAKIIKLASAADYTVPSAEYTVEIDEESIAICGDYLKVGEDLYAVIEGNFSFLAEYSFSHSSNGFMPWI